MESIIKVKNLRKMFKETVAIQNLNFEVRQGEIFGFLGPSGAGKTTTIKILTSQMISTSGEAKILGKDANLAKKALFEHIGVLTDNSGLYERLSVYDNLKIFAEINEVSISGIDHVLEKVGLLDAKKKEVKQLSRGMKQRVMIARAVLHHPTLLFLDEPTSSLDPGTTLEIHKLLRELNKEGTTIFLTTHDMVEAEKLCDRVAFLNDGEIVEIGSPQELKLKYSQDEVKILLVDGTEVRVNKDLKGAQMIYKWMSEDKLRTIHSQEPNLEEIFLRLTGRELS